MRSLPLAVSLAAAALLVASGPGVRFGLWPFGVGFSLMGVAFFVGLAGAALGVAVLAVPRFRKDALKKSVAAVALGTATALVPWFQLHEAQAYPPIHDISTDTRHPPAFVALLALRGPHASPADYDGPAAASAQARAYPDLRPLRLDAPPPEAFRRALAAARAMGWTIVATDPTAGRIEATDRTFWFGFTDDVVVRVSPAPGGSRVDVRSKSRVGRGDAGANAARIRRYLARLGG